MPGSSSKAKTEFEVVRNNLQELPLEELRKLLQASRQTLTSLADSLADRLDMQNAIRRLMRPDDMLETFSKLAVKQAGHDAACSAGERSGVGECSEHDGGG